MTRLDPTIERDILERAFLDAAMAYCDWMDTPGGKEGGKFPQISRAMMDAYRALIARTDQNRKEGGA